MLLTSPGDSPATAAEPDARGMGAARTGPRVLLTVEATYPHHLGGVSTWCDLLLQEIDTARFVVWSLATSPFVTQQFQLPPSVERLVVLPLWGTEHPGEYAVDVPSATIHRAIGITGEPDVEQHFTPIFTRFLDSISARPVQGTSVAHALTEMHDYFRTWDYRATWQSAAVWRTFRNAMTDHGQLIDDETGMSVGEGVEALRSLYRLLQPLNFEVPRCDVTHSVAASFCAIPCIVEKVERGTPFLLSEHGVRMREQYLALAREGAPYGAKRVNVSIGAAVAQAAYELADQVSPVCNFNARWEEAHGVPRARIRVIHNGVRESTFTPQANGAPTGRVVLQIARIDPLKDQVTFLRAADAVRRQLPGVTFLHYGPVTDIEYWTEVRALQGELGLDDVVAFMGATADPATAYGQADVVLLTSVSEAFPYAALEALMSGTPVVSTSAGGVAEALGGLAPLVAPGDADGLADAVLGILRMSEAERRELGFRARHHAVERFTSSRFVNEYERSYRALAGLNGPALRRDGQAPPTASRPGAPPPGSPDVARLAGEVTAVAGRLESGDEATAILESLGRTDSDARALGHRDLFHLGKSVFERQERDPELRLRRSLVEERRRGDGRSLGEPPRLRVFLSRHAATALSAGMARVAVFSLVLVVVRLRWDASTYDPNGASAIALGIVGSYLVTAGFMYALGRRGLMYLGVGVPGVARRVSYSIALAGLLAVAVAAIGFWAALAVFPILPIGHTLMAEAYFVAASCLWLSLAVLHTLRPSRWLWATAVAGGLAGWLLRTLTTLPPDACLLGGILCSAVVAATVPALVRRAHEPPPRLPRPSVVALTVAPHFLFGLAHAGFLFADRVLAWTGRYAKKGSVVWFQRDYELGVTWAFVGMGLAFGAVHLASWRLGEALGHVVRQSRLGVASDLGRRARALYWRAQSVCVFAALLGTAGSYMLVQREALIYPSMSGLTARVWSVASIAYVFVVGAWLNSSVLLSLSRPLLAARAIGIALAVNVFTGFVYSRTIEYWAAVYGLLAGSIVLWLLSTLTCLRVLDELDYYAYSTLE